MAGNSGKREGLWLVTGANGFVGQAFCDLLYAQGVPYRAVVRKRRQAQGDDLALGDFAHADWRGVLRDVSCVFHLAARAHVMQERSPDPLAEYRRANVEVSARLAEQAAAAGVRRLVFLSTVKVLGEANAGRPYTDADPPAPQDHYAISKREAEEVLTGIGQITGMEVLILRVPLIYGPGVKGNFLSLLRLVARGWPLPLASLRNRRSLLYLGNLGAALVMLGRRAEAQRGNWLLADGEDLSTPQLIRSLATALDRPTRLFPCPPILLAAAADLFGKKPAWERLQGSLAVDATPFFQHFDWTPPFSARQGLAETAAWYRRRDALI
ncbi:MAG: NAD-dependent epimerase/dehydratase family protein [Betaproteobacteria bacterium]|nr:NAD-dependent epimerase/dehydratase family protein [Betaproteobacteria bacterium]